MGQEEFQELSSFLKRFIRRFKFLKGIEGVCLTAICALLLFAVGPGVEQIKDFFPYAPLVYSIITGATLLALIVWTIDSAFAAVFTRACSALRRAKTAQTAQQSNQLFATLSAGSERSECARIFGADGARAAAHHPQGGFRDSSLTNCSTPLGSRAVCVCFLFFSFQ